MPTQPSKHPVSLDKKYQGQFSHLAYPGIFVDISHPFFSHLAYPAIRPGMRLQVVPGMRQIPRLWCESLEDGSTPWRTWNLQPATTSHLAYPGMGARHAAPGGSRHGRVFQAVVREPGGWVDTLEALKPAACHSFALPAYPGMGARHAAAGGPRHGRESQAVVREPGGSVDTLEALKPTA
jgi:hypothetical protein